MEAKEISIYKLGFPNGEVYIGKTSDYTKRMATHRSASGQSIPLNKLITNTSWYDIDKTIICTVVGKHGVRLEDFFITYYRERGVCINITGGAKRITNVIIKSMLRRIDRISRSGRLGMLIKREKDVAILMAAGLNCKEVATELGLSITTINTTMLTIQEKLRVDNQEQVFAICYQEQIFK